MSESNRTLVSLVKESTLGTIPATPNFRPVRITSAGLAYSPKSDTSKEIRADRQIPDVIRLGYEAGGTLGIESSYGALDDLIEGVLSSAWTVRGGGAFQNINGTTPITGVTNSTSQFAVTGANYAVGALVRTSGFANSGNNGIFVTVTGTAAGIVQVGGATLVNETPGVGAKVKQCGIQMGSGILSATATGLSRSAGSFITDGFVVGEWILIGGLLGTAPAAWSFATAACNGWARISAVTATTLTFDVLPAGWTSDAGTGKTIAIFQGDYVRNGTTPASYSIEEQFQDIAGGAEYYYYYGMHVGTLALSLSSQAIIEATATFMGMNSTTATTRVAGAVDLPTPTGEVLSASNNVGRLAEGGAPITGKNYVMKLDLNIDQTLRRLNAVGTPGSIGIGLGRANVTGRLSMYYDDKTVITKMRSSQASSIDLRAQSSDGTYAYLVDLPRIKYTAGDPTVQGVDTDRTIEMPFQAILSTIYGYTIHIQRFEGLQ